MTAHTHRSFCWKWETRRNNNRNTADSISLLGLSTYGWLPSPDRFLEKSAQYACIFDRALPPCGCGWNMPIIEFQLQLRCCASESEAALPTLCGNDKRSHNSSFCLFPFNLFKLSPVAQIFSSGFFPRSCHHQTSSREMMANRPQVPTDHMNQLKRSQTELTALVTSISWTFWKDVRSKNASFPCPSSFFTDVPVMRSLSSGLKQQSVLTGKQKHQQFRIQNKLPRISNWIQSKWLTLQSSWSTLSLRSRAVWISGCPTLSACHHLHSGER